MPLDNKWMDLVSFFSEYHAFDLDEIRREQSSKSATIHRNVIPFCRMFLYLNRQRLKQTVNLNPDQGDCSCKNNYILTHSVDLPDSCENWVSTSGPKRTTL